MDLLRLPLLVLTDVFKYMDFRVKFLISLMSKRARKTLKLTSTPSHLLFDFSTIPYIEAGYQGMFAKVTDEESNYLIEGELMRLRLFPKRVYLHDGTPKKQLLFASYLLDTFTKPTISIRFWDSTQPALALEFMKMINQRQVSIKAFSYHIIGTSSEVITEILDKCTEVTDSIFISAVFPNDFVYTPPRPFKAKELRVGKTTNWLNLEKFLNCCRITVELGGNSNRTAQIYNSFFTKWMDSDAPLQKLQLSNFEESEGRLIMDALSNQGTKRTINEHWFEIKRKNGSEFFIYEYHRDIKIFTKQAYLERSNKIYQHE
uniref:F-box domain-containing protein n=1 Tax=Caenorhabditis tropicalis TaxID=1561998 RepID=A0A1I7UTJ0_9PELO